MKRNEQVTSALGEGERAAKATFELLKGYVLQETVTPLKHLVKRALYGVAAALLAGIGIVVVLIGVLRVLQTETGSAFAGSWTFAPYLLTAVVAVAAIGVAAAASLRRPATSGNGVASDSRK